MYIHTTCMSKLQFYLPDFKTAFSFIFLSYDISEVL